VAVVVAVMLQLCSVVVVTSHHGCVVWCGSGWWLHYVVVLWHGSGHVASWLCGVVVVM